MPLPLSAAMGSGGRRRARASGRDKPAHPLHSVWAVGLTPTFASRSGGLLRSLSWIVPPRAGRLNTGRCGEQAQACAIGRGG